MLHRLYEGQNFIVNIIFGDESTFNISGKVNAHNRPIKSSQNRRQTLECVCDIPKFNLFCTLSEKQSLPLFFFFQEKTANGIVHLGKLVNPTDWWERSRPSTQALPLHFLTQIEHSHNNRFTGARLHTSLFYFWGFKKNNAWLTVFSRWAQSKKP